MGLGWTAGLANTSSDGLFMLICKIQLLHFGRVEMDDPIEPFASLLIAVGAE